MKIVITDVSWGTYDVEKKYLPEEAEVHCEQITSERELILACQDAEACISEYAPFTENVLRQLPKLRIISNTTVGIDNIDIEAARNYKISVSHVPDYCIREVAEHVIGFIFAHFKRIPHYNQRVKNSIWEVDDGIRGDRVSGKTLGMIGFGRIPRYISKIAKAIGMEVIVSDPYISKDISDEYLVENVDRKELLFRSDIVSCHLPLTLTTMKSIDRMDFEQMKETALFINTSRGKVVNQEDLADALKRGVIAGACLDVLEEEPPQDLPDIFLNNPNVIITPHVAYLTDESLYEVRRRSAGNITHFFKGEYDQVNFACGPFEE
jgi:D-3-phosphoglycerate dehydrogenase